MVLNEFGVGDGKSLGLSGWNWSVFVHSLRGFATKQFIAGFLFSMCCGYVNSLSQVYVDRMHWSHFKRGDYKPLPDIGFVLLPELNIARLPDIWNVVIVVCTMLPVLLFHPHKVKVLRRYAAIQGTCFLLRSITIMATILPNPYTECVNSSHVGEYPLIEAFRIMAGVRITCGDVLYSGHAANFTLMALIWQEYGRSFSDYGSRGSIPMNDLRLDVAPKHGASRFSQLEQGLPVSPDVLTLSQSDLPPNGSSSHVVVRFSSDWFFSVFFPPLFWMLAVIGYLIIIACRFHYTVDVLVGIVVVAKQWGLYHMVIRTPKLLASVPFLQWYESKGIYRSTTQPVVQIYDKVQLAADNDSDWGGFEPTPRGISDESPTHSMLYGR